MLQTLRETVARAVQKFAPPPKVSTTEWANTYRYMSAKASARPGKYNTSLTPWIPGILDAVDDPKVEEIVCMKSAQVAWTDGVINNYIGKRIHVDPVPIIVMFPKEGAAKEYSQEKFVPMVEATPVLLERVDVSASRKSDNRALFKNFEGGFLKMVGSNSTSSVKSTPAPVVVVEEPDDCNTNVKDQGDSIKLLRERTKTFSNRKILFGGTPAVKGLSRVEEAYARSDRRKFYVPCHHCDKSHVLGWEFVSWQNAAQLRHEIYGHAQPETAVYACPHCGGTWSDVEKNRNVRRGEWRGEGECAGVAGFYINELYSPFESSRLEKLVRRFLEAQHQQEQGDDGDMIVFVNSALGLPYEYASDAPLLDELADRALDYEENHVPAGGLILTAGVDVQHDRLAIIIRAWGRDDESWLVYWGEIYGNCIDKSDPVWDDLDRILFGTYKHACGRELGISAASIDSSDGQTSDAVYHYCRQRKNRGVMPVKGASLNAADREIFSAPKQSVDTNRNNSKAAKYGLKPFIVGTGKAKDLIATRLKLKGDGPGRMHWFESVRADYYEQITSEVKAPHRTVRGKLVWQKKSGVRNEALDCEVYALHAARSRKVHLMRTVDWEHIEKQILQADLFTEQEQASSETDNTPQPHRSTRKKRGKGGWVNNW